MNDDRRIPLISILILVVVIITAVAFFLLRKQSLVSPIPESSDVKVIFTSPPAESVTAEPEPTVTGDQSLPTPTKSE